MAWYQAKFPDKGAGATQMNVFVEGTDEEDVRARAASHSRLNMYDTTKGDVWQVATSREVIEEKIMDATNPNEGLTADGSVLIRDRDAGEVREVR